MWLSQDTAERARERGERVCVACQKDGQGKCERGENDK